MYFFSNQLLNINNILDHNDNGNVNTKRKINPQILIERDKEQSRNYRTVNVFEC